MKTGKYRKTALYAMFYGASWRAVYEACRYKVSIRRCKLYTKRHPLNINDLKYYAIS